MMMVVAGAGILSPLTLALLEAILDMSNALAATQSFRCGVEMSVIS